MTAADIFFRLNCLPRLMMLWVLLSFSTTALAQVKVSGAFLSDSLRVGEETAFYLSAKYPRENLVLFPDTTHDFFPFEFIGKKYFNTVTENGVSTDSAVYYLTTYEIEPTLTLQLPAYVITPTDCTAYSSNVDSIKFVSAVKANIDSVSIDRLPLKMNTAYHEVEFEFNYFILMMVLVALLAVSLIVWIIFGKRIVRYFQAKRLQKRHAAFLDAYNRILQQVQQTFSPTSAESALFVWKKYMEQLEALPYTKLTTRETYALHRDETLGNNLRAIDRAIYGHDNLIQEPLSHLRNVADERFRQKLQEVMHGK